MSATITSHARTLAATATPRPGFLGVLRGELFKLARQRTNWILFLGITGITCLTYYFLVRGPSTQDSLTQSPLSTLYEVMGYQMAIQRAFIGILLLVATARMMGLEYQNGTIRILLARGVGRLELLGAKLAAMALVALGVFAWGLLLNAALTVVSLFAVQGNLDALQSLTPAFWNAAWVDALTVLVSMGVSILLAMSVTIVGRSLAFGLTVALGWFAADNIGVLMSFLVYRFTHNDFWLNIAAYFLGPNLNVMPSVVVPALTFTVNTPKGVVTQAVPAATLGITPFVNYDGTHTLMVALVYAVIFAVAAVGVMWRRDVLE